MKSPVKWAAELAHVREVSLLGTADLAFWKARLRSEELLPLESDGQAQILLIAADAKYWGVRLRELSFTILVSRQKEGIPQDAACLERAYNSSRFLAFCERMFFSTPYSYGDVGLTASLPTSIRLVQKGEVVFRAEMRDVGFGPAREPSRSGQDGWEGAVFLPENRRVEGRPGKMFFARLRGDTRTYPFLPSEDTLELGISSDIEILQVLRDSHFVAKEWIVREDATHAKSVTYMRDEAPP